MKNWLDSVRSTTRVFCCAAVLLGATGCIATRDVTEQPEIRGGYLKGDSYVTCSDVAVTEFGVLSTAAARINIARGATTGPEGLVASGTVMRVERVVYRQHPENGASLHPMAVVQSGRWLGREADLQYLSRNVREAGRNPYTFYILEPDPKYLRKVEARLPPSP